MSDDWRSRAACRDKPPHWWFPEDSLEVNTFGKQARAVCATCPVKADCAAHGIAHEDHGIWGGLGERERARLRKRAGIRIERRTDEQLEREQRIADAINRWHGGWTVAEIAEHAGGMTA